MCGICGVAFDDGASEETQRTLVERMMGTLRHRGPDGAGRYHAAQDAVVLGHRRLSIIDLTTGDQPITTADGRLAIVFNGEIYNYRELRAELRQRGCEFRTTSDTEVLLQIYRLEGAAGLRRLNGIFAAAVWDERKRELVVMRDPLGVKPLYFAERGGRLAFASEIRALLEVPWIGRDVALDYGDLATFLTLRYVPSPGTLLRGIRKLPPGHLLRRAADGRVTLERYWREQPSTLPLVREEEAAEEYARLLAQAVRRQMVADVPVGLLLSGGIDSAVIGRLMTEASSHVKSFSVGFRGKGDYNELHDARATARLIGSEHYELELSAEDYFDVFERCLADAEEPVAEPTMPALHHVAGLAGRHVKVVLAGQGADEPLAGYDRYRGASVLARWGSALRFLPLRRVAGLVPRGELLQRGAFASAARDELSRFVAIHTIFTPDEQRRLLRPEIRSQVRDHAREALGAWYEEARLLTGSVNRLLYIDVRTSLADDLLMFGDKMTMAHSLEMRVPFLDLELLRFIESLPAGLKLRRGVGKYVHKAALRRWLPPEIIRRRKRGFATPMDEWLQHRLADAARDLFHEQGSACRLYFDLSVIDDMIAAHQARRRNHRRRLFALLVFELWHRRYLQGRSGRFEGVMASTAGARR